MWGGCGKVYGVSGEVCWRVGKRCGEGNGEDVGKCVEVWGPNTFLIPHISLLFPIPSFLPPHPNTFSYYPHVSLHLLKVWRSYHVAKLPCGEVTVAKLPCGEVTVAKLPCGEVTGNRPFNAER